MKQLNVDKIKAVVDQRKLIDVQLQQTTIALRRTNKQLKNIVQAKTIAQNISRVIQQQAHQQISTIVTKCLTLVFEQTYIFKIVFKTKRERTEAQLIFEKDDMEVDPLTSSGGGIIDVAAFALRVSCIMLENPMTDQPVTVLLDEPFKFVSKKYLSNVKLMLETLSDDLHIQFIFVTHISELIVDKHIELL